MVSNDEYIYFNYYYHLIVCIDGHVRRGQCSRVMSQTRSNELKCEKNNQNLARLVVGQVSIGRITGASSIVVNLVFLPASSLPLLSTFAVIRRHSYGLRRLRANEC